MKVAKISILYFAFTFDLTLIRLIRLKNLKLTRLHWSPWRESPKCMIFHLSFIYFIAAKSEDCIHTISTETNPCDPTFR